MPDQPGIHSKGEKPVKKPYSPPQIISREKLESVAAVCSNFNSKADGGVAPSGLDCGSNFAPLNS
jgi:hypothetical protein